MFLSKNLRISQGVSGFMIRSGCSGFGKGKTPTDSKALGSMGGNLPSTVGVLVRAVFDLGSGGLVGYTSWVDSQKKKKKKYIYIYIRISQLCNF